MKSPSNYNDSTRTTYIHLDTKKCIACWDCLAECKNQVIGKINLPWHKHSRFVNSSGCTGCFKCINVCKTGALTKISDKKPYNNTSGGKIKPAYIVNIGLLIFSLAMSFSGFAIQLKYHMGHNIEAEGNNLFSGIDFDSWTGIHKFSIIIISILMIYHFTLHWQWYKTIIIKKTAAGKKLQIMLSVFFILAAATGYIPLLIKLTGGSEIVRSFFIEIHDKIAIIFFILLSIHVTNRLKWYIATHDRIIKVMYK